MIDFYLISDEATKPKNLQGEALTYVGGLSHDVFYRLQNKGVVGGQYDYYSDFRWSTIVIQQLINRTNEVKFKDDFDVGKLLKIINHAQKSNLGLIAYCD
ncbi:MAG: hypothetical protein AAF740_03735 [Bacteroidota bacterium]